MLSFRHLSCLAVAVALSATGMVSALHILSAILSVPYVYFLAKFAFPPASSRPEPPVYGPGNKLLKRYVLFAAVIGLYLPTAYIIGGVIEGDRKAVEAAAPHLFLLSCQVFMEGVSYSAGISLPVRAFVPVSYNSARIRSIVDWLGSEFSKGDLGFGGNNWRLVFGRALAVANMGLWCYNLLGFLLPIYLPKAFKIYYTSKSSTKD